MLFSDPKIRDKKYKMNSQERIIAHRGAAGAAEENLVFLYPKHWDLLENTCFPEIPFLEKKQFQGKYLSRPLFFYVPGGGSSSRNNSQDLF